MTGAQRAVPSEKLGIAICEALGIDVKEMMVQGVTLHIWADQTVPQLILYVVPTESIQQLDWAELFKGIGVTVIVQKEAKDESVLGGGS